MNEEYLRGAHKHIGVTDDYETWINAVKDNKDYLVKLHNKLGVTDDFNTWSNSVMGTSKEAPAQADATVVGENTVSSSESILIKPKSKA